MEDRIIGVCSRFPLLLGWLDLAHVRLSSINTNLDSNRTACHKDYI